MARLEINSYLVIQGNLISIGQVGIFWLGWGLHIVLGEWGMGGENM